MGKNLFLMASLAKFPFQSLKTCFEQDLRLENEFEGLREQKFPFQSLKTCFEHDLRLENEFEGLRKQKFPFQSPKN